MNAKTWLVARREYLENVRTKTFWIGILIVPVLIAGTIFFQKLLAKSKDLRTYAVVDHSEDQWLSKEIERRREQLDFTRVFEGFTLSKSDDPATVQKEVEAQLAKKPSHPLALAWGMSDEAGRARLAAMVASASKKTLRAEIAQQVDWIKPLLGKAMDGLPKQAKEAGIALDVLRFERVPAPDLGAEPEKVLDQQIANGKLFAYFVIGKDPLGSSTTQKYVSKNIADEELKGWYGRIATEVVRERRTKALGISTSDAKALLSEFEFPALTVSDTGAQKVVDRTARAASWAPVAFLYMLWIAVFTAAQMLLTNTIEEKSNRLIEVLLSSVSPMQLMAGKVIGIGATGLTIVGSWVFFAFFGLKYGPALLGLGTLDLNLVSVITEPRLLFSFVAYFLGGYLLYAAVLVGIGSVCNSLKEAQNLMQPVFICLMVPLLAMFFVTQDPNGAMARVLTYIPLFTPFLMMNRAGGPPPTWEYVASTALIVVSIVIAFWGAAKIFRIGILMTGKPPKVREIWGWLRAPVGALPDSGTNDAS